MKDFCTSCICVQDGEQGIKMTTEGTAVDLLTLTAAIVKAVAKKVGISTDEVIEIVQRGLSQYKEKAKEPVQVAIKLEV